MAEIGEELTELHLLKSKSLSKSVTKYKGTGEDLIEKPIYDAEREAVFLSSPPLGGGGIKYFEGITKEMWNYHIGGYQVLEKYLKDRKGRQMVDPATYCKIATAISATIQLQKTVDKYFAEA
jgi:hypothetical protein